MNTQEYWEKQVLFARRQNQPAGYGFYFPAIDDHEDEDMLISKMVCDFYSVTPIELSKIRSMFDVELRGRLVGDQLAPQLAAP